MLKGVNKTVIEINDTGSKYFNKAILFLSPEYCGNEKSKIRKEAKKAIGKIDLSLGQGASLVSYNKRKSKLWLILLALLVVSLCGFLIIFKLII